jgi:hypothetical protein
MKLGYARVSTEDQNLDGQRQRLSAAGCEKLFGYYPGQIAWRDFESATELPFVSVSPPSGKAAGIGDGLDRVTNNIANLAAL